MAKLDMMRSGRSDPFYWGAFILCGDAGKIALDDEHRQAVWTGGIVYVMLGFALVGTICVIILSKHRKALSHL